ncbi:uncharacterized protein EDB91DRAFT_809760 [Suillus paluster]|uniref:uncharacterized protein n=1 Tax=Suillus paluster TaxID=48578 RepID=UPI001B877E84|nr:uncharacterized protein EDB91DRAFT_809760 [Suillus paluster]KAG1729484.1 hypothetical protein EDB91DRAFT_809760 [Suillus paluster]
MDQNIDMMGPNTISHLDTSVSPYSSASSSQNNSPFAPYAFFPPNSTGTTPGTTPEYDGVKSSTITYHDAERRTEQQAQVYAHPQHELQPEPEAQPQLQPQPFIGSYPPDMYSPRYVTPRLAPNAPAFNTGGVIYGQQTMMPGYAPHPPAAYPPQQYLATPQPYHYPVPPHAYAGYAPPPQAMNTYLPSMQAGLAPAVAVSPPVSVSPPQAQAAAAATPAPATQPQPPSDRDRLLQVYTAEQLDFIVATAQHVYGTDAQMSDTCPTASSMQPQMQGTGYYQHVDHYNQGFMQQLPSVGSSGRSSVRRRKRRAANDSGGVTKKRKRIRHIPVDQDPDFKNVGTKDGKTIFQCLLTSCNGIQMQESSVRNHKTTRTHKPEESARLPCLDCGQLFSRSDSLNRHQDSGQCELNQKKSQEVSQSPHDASTSSVTNTFAPPPPVAVPEEAFTVQVSAPATISVPHQNPPMPVTAAQNTWFLPATQCSDGRSVPQQPSAAPLPPVTAQDFFTTSVEEDDLFGSPVMSDSVALPSGLVVNDDLALANPSFDVSAFDIPYEEWCNLSFAPQ